MAGLKLYNTLTRTKEDFVPLDAKNVRMYVCGPTVYDFAHIGNARPVIVFDVLYRLLRHLYGPQHVTYVRNITDVDDKINARALREFGAEIAGGTLSLNQAIRKVTEKTEKQFHADAAALGCLKPDFEPRATEHIDGMVRMIQQLLDKGHAYVATGSEGAEVLFDVAAMPDYGRLSRRNLDEQQAGARVAVEPHKKNPADFVLWKQSDATAPGWHGHFHFQGRHIDIHGRPGWHIECSVMSEAHLGLVFDIHGGGLDLIFPHHENEIAQSRCAHGTDVMANYWMHNGFLQVEGRKMAKSEGNFVTINELLNTDKFGGRNWPGEVLRLAMLMTHYREPIDFSVRRLEEANTTIRRWRDSLASHHIALNPHDAPTRLPDFFVEYLCDDLSFSSALSGLHELANLSRSQDRVAAEQLAASVDFLGLKREAWDAGDQELLFKQVADDDFDRQFRERVSRRLALLREKNFAEADRIRDELAAQGIQLMDYKDPQTGERKTKWEVKR